MRAMLKTFALVAAIGLLASLALAGDQGDPEPSSENLGHQ
jgi:hypothetical protein